ncbi:hypothetical protein FRB94_004722 [Tulasnella sp. JGI-2019a]|nr:hypothetical protein FRB93_011377 [Tulasnella sp. JGI-2019a]KAG9012912.1 hypothetical protein FRB94_004722 [Tulasnella sp. JGI-2019a]
MRLSSASVALLGAIPAVFCAPSTSSVGSSIIQLFQNNLNYTDDQNHISALLLEEPLTSDAASKACAALGETPLPLSIIEDHLSDLIPQFTYLAYQSLFSTSQSFTTSNGAIRLNGASALTTTSLGANAKSPVLCTQSSAGTINSNSVPTAKNMIAVASGTNTFIGFRNAKSFRFLGIPYSNPTARFTYSTVYSATHQTINATAFGPQCYQTYGEPNSEQCQFLNIFTPYIPQGKTSLKPVLVWIHGGAFTSGSGSDPTADGGNMASRGDIVVVTINYRLSTLGFLAVPGTSITGNYGIADQITALEWVQANIAAFGGDPNKITIGGQSAGAGSVRVLLGSPKAVGKFSAAIPGSNLDGLDYAATYSNYYTPAQEAIVSANPIVTATGCNGTDPNAIVTCLKAVDPLTLVNSPNAARYVIVDGTYVTTPELEVTGKGPAARVPTMWGTMADDAAAFIGYPTAAENVSQAIQSLNYLSPNLTAAIVDSGLFPVPNTGNYTLDLFNVSARVATDIQFRCLDQATVYSAVKHNVFGTTYYYQFDRSYQTPGYDPNAPVCDAPVTAAYPHGNPNLPYFKCHSGDLYYEFGTMGQFGYPLRDANDVVMTQLVMDHWTSFVRTHDPNPDPSYLIARGYTSTLQQTTKAGHWNAATPGSDTLRRLSVPSSQSPFLEVPQCQLLGLPLNYYETQSS